jgi:hypothetical protein
MIEKPNNGDKVTITFEYDRQSVQKANIMLNAESDNTVEVKIEQVLRVGDPVKSDQYPLLGSPTLMGIHEDVIWVKSNSGSYYTFKKRHFRRA